MTAGFLVEGHTEQKIVQAICPKAVVQRINLNGNSVEANAIAVRVATQARLWGGKYRPIVILVDREKRTQTAVEFAASLSSAIRDQGIEDPIVVGVADRMIENWILANPSLWPNGEAPDNVDGTAGATQLKKLRRNSYAKSSDGPRLFKECSPSALRQRSPSFRSFADQLELLKCRWLARCRT